MKTTRWERDLWKKLLLFLVIHVYSSLSSYLDCKNNDRSNIVVGVNDCPGFFVDNFTLNDIGIPQINLSLGSYSNLEGLLGYPCDITLTGQLLPFPTAFYTQVHHYVITVQIPWCFNSFSFSGHCGITAGAYSPYESYFGPSVLLNDRPIQPECLDSYSANNTEFQPFPLWDQGTETLGTVTLYLNDSCTFNSTLQKTLDGFFYLLTNGSYILANGSGYGPDFINNITTTGSVGNFLYSSHAVLTPPTTACDWCFSTCNVLPQPYCFESPRTLPKRQYFRTRAVTSLACKDTANGFGFVWRVENIYSYNLHFDWFLSDVIQGVLLPVATNTTYIDISRMNISLNTGYNDGLFNGFWPNVAGKRNIVAGQYFYIPTYVPSNASNISLTYGGDLRPTLLDLYAGFPHHYLGTTNLAGMVDFFDMRTALNMSAFINFGQTLAQSNSIVSPAANATYTDRNITKTIRFDSTTLDLYIPKDYDRQVILAICKNNNQTVINEIVQISGISGWYTLCNSLNNTNTTWNETLSMLYYNFTGLISSPTSDPVPVCECENIERSPCGNVVSGSPNMMTAYTPPAGSLVVNATIDIVCKINAQTLAYTYKTFGNQSDPLFVNLLYNASKTNGDYGYIWSIKNNNISPEQVEGLTSEYTTTQNDLFVRWAMGTYTPPNGNVSISGPPLPYPYPTGTVEYISPVDESSTPTFYATQDADIRSGTIWFFLSMTSSSHKFYGTFQQICTTGDCTLVFPKDPPTLQSPYGWSIAKDLTQLVLVPDCQCGVNIPCELGSFLFNVNASLNFSTLDVTIPNPLPPIQYATVPLDCAPTLEVCNGLDDNCDGIVDNIPGWMDPCGPINLDNTGICRTGLLFCPNFTQPSALDFRPLCIGLISPEEEICNGIDDNCDGIIDNINPEICGYNNQGICQLGYTICLTNFTKVCFNAIYPSREVCGDGIDNDCDGQVDNGCANILQYVNILNLANYYTPDVEYLNSRTAFYPSPNNDKVKTQDVPTNFQLVYAMNVVDDVINFITVFFASLWLILISICITCVFVTFICACGPFGGLWTFFYGNNFGPWDTYGLSQNETEPETTINENETNESGHTNENYENEETV